MSHAGELAALARTPEDPITMYDPAPPASLLADGIPVAAAILTTEGPGGAASAPVDAVALIDPDARLLLVALAAASRAAELLRDNGCFRVDVLAAGQEALAAAVVDPDSALPEMGAWELDAPFGAKLTGAAASAFCRVESSFLVGSRIVVLGEVDLFENPADVDPLLRLGRTSRRVEQLPLSVFPGFTRGDESEKAVER